MNEKDLSMSKHTARECVPLFSFIMPVYNAAGYLPKAIESILTQKFRSVELVLVNDCSKDASADICRAYAKRDSRVVFLDLPSNAGAGNARNQGIHCAHGVYIGYVDADDTVEPGLFQLLANVIGKYQPDAVKFGLWEEYYSGGEIAFRKKVTAPAEFLSTKEEVRRRIVDWEMLPVFGYNWNTLYRRSLLERLDIQFFDYAMLEDFLYNLEFFSHVRSAVMLEFAGYHYAKRDEGSLSSRPYEQYYPVHQMKIEKLLEKYQTWGLLDVVTERKIFWLYTRIVYSHLCRTMALHGKRAAEAVLSEVRESALYGRYRGIDFSASSVKKRLLVHILRDGAPVMIWLFCQGIVFAKRHLQAFFVKLKG